MKTLNFLDLIQDPNEEDTNKLKDAWSESAIATFAELFLSVEEIFFTYKKGKLRRRSKQEFIDIFKIE